MQEILFPYDEVRDEQSTLIEHIKDAITNKTHLVVHAPTGLGKTAATLAPALRYAIDNDKVIFFLTSRHTQHTIAIETLQKIREKFGTQFGVADMVGKKWMCLQQGIEFLGSGDFSEYCKHIREEGNCEYYAKARDSSFKPTVEAKQALVHMTSLGPLHVEDLKNECRGPKLCPYEMALMIARNAKVIVTDYSYIFNPRIREAFLAKAGIEIQNCIIIIDEAHNLPSRARDQLSNKLTSAMLGRAKAEAKKFGYTETIDLIAQLEGILEDIAKDVPVFKERLVKQEDFVMKVKQNIGYVQLQGDLDAIGEAIRETQQRSAIGGVAAFLDSWLGQNSGFARIISRYPGNQGDVMTLSYRCLDPSVITRDVIAASHSTIAMSGTLTPMSMYRDVLGFPEGTQEAMLESPFSEENKLTLVIPKTSTKYSLRTEDMYAKMAKIIAEVTNTVPGNCAVFFPSYALRDSVYRYYADQGKKTVFLEQPKMTKEEKTELLEKFKGYMKSGAVMLGAISGNFSEGIDLPGDFLKCVVVVGLPLGQPDLETKELIAYYDTRFNRGWDYGYVLPAFNRCLQSAGRCIRSETDKGCVVFLDERYIWPMYRRYFPPDSSMKATEYWVEEIEQFFGIRD